MKKLFSLVLIVLTSTILAQTQEKDSLSNWTKKGVFTLLFNQSSFSNWIAGGENAISVTGSINYDFNYKKGDWNWDNKIITKYGLNKIANDETKKTDDLFEFNSVLGKKASKELYYSFFLNLRSQFTDGFDYSAEPIKEKTSRFFSPGYLTFGPGILYKKSDNFNINLSPATSKATFVAEEFTRSQDAFGVEKGETTRYELGFYAAIYYKFDLMKNVNIENIFNAYSNYLEKPQNIDINYQMNLVMQVNKYLSANLNFHMIVDDNASSEIQYKEVFGLGINYIF